MANCDYCGSKVIWVQFNNGIEIKNIALDVNEPVYHFDGERWVQSKANVNHFAVCPFRKKWRKDQIEKKQKFEKELEEKKATARAWWLDLDK